MFTQIDLGAMSKNALYLAWGAKPAGYGNATEKSPIRPESISHHRNGGRSISKYRAGETVFSQGKPADAIFYIQNGKVIITVVSEQGKEAVVAVLGPDEFCGEGCLNGQPLRLATATALTECEIMRLEKATMVRVLHEEPAFSEMFVSHLLARTPHRNLQLIAECCFARGTAHQQMSRGQECRAV